jgi:hypothetical protein
MAVPGSSALVRSPAPLPVRSSALPRFRSSYTPTLPYAHTPTLPYAHTPTPRHGLPATVARKGVRSLIVFASDSAFVLRPSNLTTTCLRATLALNSLNPSTLTRARWI